MKCVVKRILMPLVLLIAFVGFMPTAAGATTTNDQSILAVAPAAPTLSKGPWQVLESNFSTYTGCMSRGAYLMKVTGGYWIGGMADYDCKPYTIPACPSPISRWNLMSRDWFSPNGPFVIDPDDVAATASTIVPSAC